MKELIIKVLSVAPNSTTYKEFFSFFREIFYYNKDMDDVDFELACDSLHILNHVPKTSSATQIKETISVKGSVIEHVNIQDYFMFSDMSPGVILTETLKIPQESFAISLLFKLNLVQVKAMQQTNGGPDRPLLMTFFHIIDRNNQTDYMPY